MAVKFLMSTQVGTLYNEGEIAAFDAETEAELVEAKVAELVEAKVAELVEAKVAEPVKAKADKASGAAA